MANQSVGSWRGVQVEVAAWDGGAADVELSCACMFTREREAAGPVGGLAHLDGILSGALTGLRREGHFRGEPLETLLVSTPPDGIAAEAVLLIGLGDPESWSVAATAAAVGAAVSAAVLRSAKSAAFAPSILDGGMTTAAAHDLPLQMIRALVRAVELQHRLAQLGLAPSPSLSRWVFDVGAERFEDATAAFRRALEGEGMPQ